MKDASGSTTAIFYGLPTSDDSRNWGADTAEVRPERVLMSAVRSGGSELMVGSTGLVSHDCGGTTLAVASAVHASKEGPQPIGLRIWFLGLTRDFGPDNFCLCQEVGWRPKFVFDGAVRPIGGLLF